MKRLKSPEIPSPSGAPDPDERRGQGSSGNSLLRLSERCQEFQYEELFAATNGFSPESKIGEGGFGPVHKGTIQRESGRELVAVKQLKVGRGQGEREFLKEIYTISRAHHRHVVSLVGYCISGSHRLLVYKFVPNGTMGEALHGPGRPCMNWATRMKIALGTARGLVYLHEGCDPKIIHRDIKSSNILLDNQWEAQVADFGLAKETNDSHTLFSDHRAGTSGYVAPEYAQYGSLSFKADVYSFGVVLLELITGKKAIDVSLLPDVGHVSLVEWAKPRLRQALKSKNMETIADPNLEGEYDKKEMFNMVEVADACVRRSYHDRPKMAEALQVLSPRFHLNQGNNPGQSGEFVSEEPFEDDLKRLRQLAFSQSSSDGREHGRSDEVVGAINTTAQNIVADGQPIEDSQPANPDRFFTPGYIIPEEAAQLSSALGQPIPQPIEEIQPATTGEQGNTFHVFKEDLDPSAPSTQQTPPKPHDMISKPTDQQKPDQQQNNEEYLCYGQGFGWRALGCAEDSADDYYYSYTKAQWARASSCGKACIVLDVGSFCVLRSPLLVIGCPVMWAVYMLFGICDEADRLFDRYVKKAEGV